jgi:uncharacterized integral membrane protein
MESEAAMSVQLPQEPQHPVASPEQRTHRAHVLRTALIVLLAVILTLFAVKNWQPVPVWPLGARSLTLVITISFVLGALIGWLAHSLTFGRPPRPRL